MTYNFSYISNELRDLIESATEQSHRFEDLLSFRQFDNAYIAPYIHWDQSIGCALDNTGTAILDSICKEWNECGDYYNIQQSQKEDNQVIFLGFFLNIFGHSYTDNLRKLWFIETEQFKSLIAFGAEVVYTTNRNEPLNNSVKELLRFAGYDISQARHITELTQFNKVFIPDNCLRATSYGRIYSKEYKNLIDRIKQSQIAKKQSNCSFPAKIYFTRSKYIADKNNKETGEQSIERVFKKNGFTIISPEDYTFSEQIQMVQNCHSFAATEGSVAHLCVFCNPHTDVVIINKANYLNFHQVMINEFANLNVTYIEAHHSSKVDPEHPWWGPFYLCITKYLERYIGHPIIHVPYWIRFSYWRYTRNILYRCYNRGRKILNRVFMK